MQDQFPRLVISAHRRSSGLAVVAYNRLGSTRKARPTDPLSVEQLRITARWAMSKGDKDTGLVMLQGALQRHVYDGTRQTFILNANAENGATWTRQLKDTCDFCKEHAGTYDTLAGDAEHFHDGCSCLVVPNRP